MKKHEFFPSPWKPTLLERHQVCLQIFPKTAFALVYSAILSGTAFPLNIFSDMCNQAGGVQHSPTFTCLKQASWCPQEQADWLRDDASFWRAFWGILCSLWARLYWQSPHHQHDCEAQGADTNTTLNGRRPGIKHSLQLSSTMRTSLCLSHFWLRLQLMILLLVCLNTVKLDV